jgi:tetratricopeptide (TPR) repeat protein
MQVLPGVTIKTHHMKQVLWLLLMAALSAKGQNHGEAISEQKTSLLLDKIRLQLATEDDRNDLQKIALALQDKGQWLDEHSHDYKKAAQHIDRAIELYQALGDSLNLAFNKKYKGLLLVRQGKTAAAKAEIRSAIDLYRRKNTGAGVAAAQFDLARIFEYDNKQDSAIYYAEQARAYWKEQEDNLQIIVINNMLVYHLLQQSRAEKAQLVYNESKLLLAKQPTHWQPLLDFYFTSMLLFRQINDATLANQYRELYFDKMETLKKEGISAKSYYESYGQ